MTLRIACRDVGGMNCDFTAEAETEQELLQKVAKHAAEAHGMTSIDSATLGKVKGAIKRV
jgi:predicted small metal-binding protein